MDKTLFTSTLISALVFSSVFWLGRNLRDSVHYGRTRSLVSLAAGASLAYVFLHVLPILERVRVKLLESLPNIPHPFEGHAIYAGAMLGFIAFYGLDRAKKFVHREAQEKGGVYLWPSRIYLGSISVNVWLVSYFLVRGTEKELASLALYTGALALHYLVIAYNLRRENGSSYNKVEAPLLAGMSLFGWLCGVFFNIPGAPLYVLISLVAGAIMMNTMISELGNRGEGKFIPFACGAIVYAVLLLFAH